jgi:hypothetical protein
MFFLIMFSDASIHFVIKATDRPMTLINRCVFPPLDLLESTTMSVYGKRSQSEKRDERRKTIE